MKLKKLFIVLIGLLRFIGLLHTQSTPSVQQAMQTHNSNYTNAPKRVDENFELPELQANPRTTTSNDYVIYDINQRNDYITPNTEHSFFTNLYIRATIGSGYVQLSNVYMIVTLMYNDLEVGSFTTSKISGIAYSHYTKIGMLYGINFLRNITYIDTIKITLHMTTHSHYGYYWYARGTEIINDDTGKAYIIGDFSENYWYSSPTTSTRSCSLQGLIQYTKTEKARIYFDTPYIDKHDWDNLQHSWLSSNLKPKLRTGNINLSTLYVDSSFRKESSTDSITYTLRSQSSNVSETQISQFQLNTVDLSNIFKLSKNDGKEWNWVNDKYFYYTPNSQPKLTFYWNNDFFNSVNAKLKQNEVFNKIAHRFSQGSELWWWVTNAISNFQVNEYNIDALIEHFNSRYTIPNLNDLPNPAWRNKNYAKYASNSRNWFEVISYLLSDPLLSLSYEIKYVDSTGNIKLKTETISNPMRIDSFSVNIPTEFLSHDSHHLNWKISVQNFSVRSPRLNQVFKASVEINESSNELSAIYGQNISHSQSVIDWSVKYQAKPYQMQNGVTVLNIKTGEVMNEKFQIIKTANGNSVSSPGTSNDSSYGYKNAYINLTTEIKKKFSIDLGNSDRLYISKYSGRWKLKSNRNIDIATTLGSLFDEREIVYLFADQLHVIIKPDSQLNTIERVVDKADNVEIVLEDFQENKTSNWFDNIFGADPLNTLDAVGTLGSGIHKIEVKYEKLIDNAIALPLFEIDSQAPIVKVESANGRLLKTHFDKPNVDGSRSIHTIYISDRPMHLTFEDANFESIFAEFIDSFGNWYQGPMQIRQTESGLLQSYLRQNYQGLMRFKTRDALGNVEEIYSLLRVNNKFDGMQQIITLDDSSNKLISVENLTSENYIDHEGNTIKAVSIKNINATKTLLIDNDPLLHSMKIEKMNSGTEWEVLSETIVDSNKVLSEFFSTKKDNQVIPESGAYPNDLFDLMGDNVRQINTSSVSASEGHLTSLKAFELKKDTLYRVSTLSNVQKISNTYYIYLYDRTDINFYKELVDMLSDEGYQRVNMITDATITQRVIDGRKMTLTLEKEQFYANYNYQHSKKMLFTHIEKYDLNSLEKELSGWKEYSADVEGSPYAMYLNAKEKLTSIQNNVLIIEGISKTFLDWCNYLESDDKNSPLFNSVVKQINEILNSDEYIDVNKTIIYFENNVEVQIAKISELIDDLRQTRNALTSEIEKNEKLYEEAKSKWKNSLVIADERENVISETAKLIDSSKYAKIMVASFLLPYAKTLVTELGYVLFGKMELNAMPFENKNVGHLFKVEYYNPMKAEIEKVNFIVHRDNLSLDGIPLKMSENYIFDGPLTFNGSELEDIDHLMHRQTLFIENNPDVDVNILWKSIIYPSKRESVFDGVDYKFKEDEAEIITKEIKQREENASETKEQSEVHNLQKAQKSKVITIVSTVILSGFTIAYLTFVVIKRVRGSRIK